MNNRAYNYTAAETTYIFSYENEVFKISEALSKVNAFDLSDKLFKLFNNIKQEVIRDRAVASVDWIELSKLLLLAQRTLFKKGIVVI